MNLIISYSCLLWLVYVSLASSEQANQHHEDPMVTVTKEVDSKPRQTDSEDMKEFSSPDLKERKADWDSSFDSGSSSFEEEGMKDRGLFDGGLFGGFGKQRRRNGGMFSQSSFSGGYGGYGGRRGRLPYGRQFNEDPRYGMGYGNGGFGGAYPDRRYSMQPYPNRFTPYSGGRGGRGGRGGGRQYGGFPGQGGFYGQQPSFRQPYSRDLQLESNVPVEPAVAR